MNLSPSSFRNKSSNETPHSSTEGDESEDEGPGSESEDSEDKGHDSKRYKATRRRALELAEGHVPSTFETGQSSRSVPDAQMRLLAGSLPVSPASLTVPSPVASPVTTPLASIVVEEDEFLEVGAHLELYRSTLHDHTQHLDALPPTLLEGLGAWNKERSTLLLHSVPYGNQFGPLRLGQDRQPLIQQLCGRLASVSGRSELSSLSQQ
ncbi:hypothetical protein Tco_1153002 [Tanacetum coccineum]